MPFHQLQKGHKLFPLFSLHILYSFSTDVFTLSCPVVDSRMDTSCSLSSPYIFFTRFLLTSLPYRALSSTPERTQAVPSLLLTYSLLVFSWRLYLIVPCRRLQKGYKLFPLFSLTYFLLVFYWRLYLIVPCRRLQKGHKLFPLFSLHILYSFSTDVFTLSCPVVDSRKDTSCSLSSPYIFVARFLLTSLPYRALSSTPERTQAVPSLLLTYSLLVFYWRLYLIVPCRRLQKGHKLFPLLSLHILYSFSTDVYTLSCPVVDSRKDTSCSLSCPYIFITRFLLTSLPYRALSSTPERTQAVPSLLLTYSLFLFYWGLYLIVPCRRLQKGHKLFPLFPLHILYSFSTDVFTLSCPVVDSRKDTSCSLSSPYIFFTRFLLTSLTYRALSSTPKRTQAVPSLLLTYSLLVFYWHLPYRALSSTPERTQAVPSLLLTYFLLVFYWRLYLIVPCRRLQKGHKLFPLFSLHILYSFSTDVFTLSCPVVDSRKDTSCSLSSPYIFVARFLLTFTLSCPVVDSRKDTSCSLSSPYIFFTRFLLTSLPYRALSSTPERTQAVPSLLLTYSLLVFYWHLPYRALSSTPERTQAVPSLLLTYSLLVFGWRLYLIVPFHRLQKGHKLFPLSSLHILYSFSTDVFTLSCPSVNSRNDISYSLSSPYIFVARFLLTSLPYRALSSTTERTQAVPSLLLTYLLLVFYWRLYLIVPCRRLPKGHKLFPLFSFHILYSFSTDVFTLSCPVVDSRKDTSCSLSSPYIFFIHFLLTSLPYRALSSIPERTQAVPSLLLTYSLLVFYWRLYLIVPCRRLQKGHKLFPLFSLHILYSFSTDFFTLSCPVVDSRKDTSCSLSSPYIFFTRFLLTSLTYRALSSTPKRTQAVPSLLLSYSLLVFLLTSLPYRALSSTPERTQAVPSLLLTYSLLVFLLTSLPYRALSSTPERTQAVPSLLLTYSLLLFYWRLYLIVPCRRLQKGHKLFPLSSLHILYSFSTDVFTLSCPVVDSRKDTSCSLSSPYIFFTRFLLTSLPYRALSSTTERTQAVPSLLLTYLLLVFYWRLYLIVPCRRLPKGHKLFPLFSFHILYSFSTDVFTLSCPVVDSRKDTSCSLSSPYIFFIHFLLTSLPYRALLSIPERTQAVPSLLLTYSLLVFYWRLYLIVPCRRLQKGHKLFPLFSLHILYSFSTDVFTLSCPVVDSRKDTSCSLSSPYIFVARFLLTSLPYRALPSTTERTQAVTSLLLTYSLLVFYWRLYLIVPCRRLQKGHKLFPLFSLHILYSFSTDVFTLSCPVVDSRKDTSCSLSSPYIFVARFLLTFTLSCPVVDSRKDTSCSLSSPYIFFTRFLLTSSPYRALSSTPERTQAVPSLLLTYSLLVFYWHLPYRALSSTPERTQAVPSLLLTYSLLVFYWRLYLIVPCRRLQKGHKLFPLFSLHIRCSFSTDIYLIVPCRRLQKGHKLFPLFSLHIRCSSSADVFTWSCPSIDSRKDTSCSLSPPYIFFTRFLLTSLHYRALPSTPERT